jgi:hypothetical protein
MDFHPEDPRYDAAISAFVRELPWELQDVTRALIRALRSDAEPFRMIRGATERYTQRARRVGQSLQRVVASVDELVGAFLVPRVADDDRAELRRRVLSWVTDSYGRGA